MTQDDTGRGSGGLWRLLVVVTAALACQLVAPLAEAHVALVASSPAAGDMVLLSTTSVRLAFGDDVAPTPVEVVVRDRTGSDVVLGRPAVSGGSVEVEVELDRPGRYEVAYRVLGVDGHPLYGEYAFTARTAHLASGRVGPAGTGVAAPVPAPPLATGPALASATNPDGTGQAVPWLPWLCAAGALAGLMLVLRVLTGRVPPSGA